MRTQKAYHALYGQDKVALWQKSWGVFLASRTTFYHVHNNASTPSILQPY